jgi:hypothetical protein
LRESELTHYRVVWSLAGGESKANDIVVGQEVIRVIAADTGVLLESVESPTLLNAGEQTKVDIVVANAGLRAWAASEAQVAYSWYRWDGRPLGGAVNRTPVTVAVAPGERALVTASLQAPQMPGPYRLAWYVVIGGNEGAAFGESQRREAVVSPVFVRSAEVQPVDLSSYTNVPAVATDSYRARGDFDGRGRSLPAELLPPDQSGPVEPLYPSGYYAPGDENPAIPFSFPNVSSGIGGAVACNGQTVPLGERGAVAVHLLVASTEGERETTFGLAQTTGEVEPITVVVPGWEERSERLPVAAYCPYVRTLSNDDPAQPAYLYHLVLKPGKGAASALQLPKEPWIKVLAVTIESAPAE